MTRMLPMMPRMRMMAKEMGTKKRVSLRIMISLSLFILVTSEALSVSTEFVMCSITSTPIMITSSAAILLLYTLVAIGAEKNVRKKCEIMRQLIFCAETCLKELDWHFNITTKRGCERVRELHVFPKWEQQSSEQSKSSHYNQPFIEKNKSKHLRLQQ